MPGLSDVLSKERDNADDSCDIESENVRLYLPSEFTREERTRYKLDSMAQVELELRKGEANDAIQDLRLQINFRTALEGQKVHVKYTKGNTRAAKIIQDASKAKNAAANAYRLAREAIISLGGNGINDYKDLEDAHLETKSVNEPRDPNQKGKVTDSWIYTKVTELSGSAADQAEWDKDSKSTTVR